MKRIAVIGGGASGMIAAYFAAKKDTSVTIFEKQDKLGKKILVTGNGRCNISNINISVDKYNGSNPKFVLNIFSRFGPDDTVSFFDSIGLPLIEGKNGKLFPSSLQASAVVKIFTYELGKKNVDIRPHRKIDDIKISNGIFQLLTSGKEIHEFDSVILSAGSCAYPQVGGSKSGTDLARHLGHTVIDPFPAILPINIPLKALHRLQGTKWECGITVINKDRNMFSAEGELLFTGYGISGNAALDISRTVNKLVIDGESPKIIIDFFPGINRDSLSRKFNGLWRDNTKKLSFSFTGIINDKIPQVVLEIAGINPDARISSLSVREKEKIADAFKSLTLIPGNPRSFNEAVVAAGGINVGEINPATMESKIIKNLFITGELLDIDGISGGYNLQFAWSTGAIAGMSQ